MLLQQFPASTLGKDDVKVCKYIQRRCVRGIRARCGLLPGQIIVCRFDLITFFLMRNILDKVSEAEQAGGRHQRDEKYLILSPWWDLVKQLYSTVIMCVSTKGKGHRYCVKCEASTTLFWSLLSVSTHVVTQE